MKTNDPKGVLKVCVARRLPVDIFLLTGVKLRCSILRFDDNYLTLTTSDGKMLVSRSAVASIVAKGE